jgi:hypothetical protein
MHHHHHADPHCTIAVRIIRIASSTVCIIILGLHYHCMHHHHHHADPHCAIAVRIICIASSTVCIVIRYPLLHHRYLLQCRGTVRSI